jgi:dolichol-phosphate mannosyltransferase
LNEDSNIGKIITDVNGILHENAINGKILVVDDNSTDKTIKIVNDLKQTHKNLDILIRAFDHRKKIIFFRKKFDLPDY